MKQAMFLTLILLGMGSASTARASSLAPRNRPRCSMTTPSIVRRLLSEPVGSDAFNADASHLFPHVEIAYVPFGIRDEDRSFQIGSFQQTAIAIKPSVALCGSEFHVYGEIGIGELDERTKYLVNDTEFNVFLTGRLGFEALIRPARWLPESARIADALAIGLGLSIGGAAITPMNLQGFRRKGVRMEIDEIVEFGPRIVFDALDWLAFTAAFNIRVSTFELEISKQRREEERLLLGAGTIIGVQFSIPAHILFHDEDAHAH